MALSSRLRAAAAVQLCSMALRSASQHRLAASRALRCRNVGAAVLHPGFAPLLCTRGALALPTLHLRVLSFAFLHRPIAALTQGCSQAAGLCLAEALCPLSESHVAAATQQGCGVERAFPRSLSTALR